MGKDLLIKILQDQLQASKANIAQLNLTVENLQHTVVNLNRTISDQNRTILELRQTIANQEDLLKERDASMAKAKAQMRGLKSTFLPKKSEKQNSEPVQKSQEELQAEERKKSEERKARGNNGAKRKEHFEMETMEEDVYPDGMNTEDCSEMGVHDIVRYEMVPLKIIKRITHMHVFKKNDGTILSGKTPLAPFQNSNFDGSFITGMAELRYLYSMPVERIVKYFQGHGFEINKATAHGLLAKTANLFENLYKALQKAVKEDKYINCDETYYTILIKAGKGSKKGYIWVIIAAHLGLVYFFYEDGSRKEEVILRELEGYKGLIQSDGLGAYKKVALFSNGNIVRAGCIQHCRRDFLDDSIKDNPDSKQIVSLVGDLYHCEQEHKIGEDGWTVEDNLKWRQEYAPPILSKLKTELTRIRNDEGKYPPTSLMHKAANYFLNEWEGIETISHYGDVDWDNNRAERGQRCVSLSRRNSLFFGSHAGARRGCIFYSLASSCQNNDVNFFEYMSDVINKAASLPPGTPLETYRNLLPDRWRKE